MTEEKQTNKQDNEVLSFEAITEEIGDINIPVEGEASTATEEALPADFFPEGGTVMGDDAPVQKDVDEDEIDRINSRVLAGCSPKTRHMYVEGIFCGILASLFMLPIVLRTGFVAYQPWFSYFSMVLAGGAVIWSLSGLQVETKVEGKRLCIASAVFCAAVVLIAFLYLPGK